MSILLQFLAENDCQNRHRFGHSTAGVLSAVCNPLARLDRSQDLYDLRRMFLQIIMSLHIDGVALLHRDWDDAGFHVAEHGLITVSGNISALVFGLAVADLLSVDLEDNIYTAVCSSRM
jgi:hypothetical protein